MFSNRRFSQQKQVWNLRGHEKSVWSVGFNADATRAVSGSEDATIRIWDTLNLNELGVLKGHESGVESVSFSADGTKIVSGSADKTIRVWDALDFKELRVFNGHEDSVLSVKFSVDGSRIVSGSWDKTIRVWDTATSRELGVLKGHESGVNSISFCVDGSRIVSGSGDKTIRVWSIVALRGLHILKGHERSVKSVNASADGGILVSGGYDRTVRVRDAAKLNEVGVLRGHTSFVTSVTVSADGKRIVSGSDDKTVRIWDVVKLQEIGVLRGHEAPVTSVSISVDGARIVSGGTDKVVKVWTSSAVCEEFLSMCFSGEEKIQQNLDGEHEIYANLQRGLSSSGVSFGGIVDAAGVNKEEIKKTLGLDYFGWTSLHLASSGGNLVGVKNLLEMGAEVNLLDLSRQTPLHVACFYGELEIVKVLLEHGAEINFLDIEGKCALYLAYEKRFLEVVKYLLDIGVDTNCMGPAGAMLHMAYLVGREFEGGLRRLEFFLGNGYSINEYDRSGYLVLDIACSKGDFEGVKYLVEVGSRLNNDKGKAQYGWDRYNALYLAWESGEEKLLSYLTGRNAVLEGKARGDAEESWNKRKYGSFFDALKIAEREGKASFMTEYNEMIHELEKNTCEHMNLAGEGLSEQQLEEVVTLIRKSTSVKRVSLGYQIVKLSIKDFQYLDERFFGVLKQVLSEGKLLLSCDRRRLKDYLMSLGWGGLSAFYLRQGYGYGALHLAAMLGARELAVELLSEEKLWFQDRIGRLPDAIAKEYGHFELIEAFTLYEQARVFEKLMSDKAWVAAQKQDLGEQHKRLKAQISSYTETEALLSVAQVRNYWLGVFRVEQLIKAGRMPPKIKRHLAAIKAPHLMLEDSELRIDKKLKKTGKAFTELQACLKGLGKAISNCQKLELKSLSAELLKINNVLESYLEKLSEIREVERRVRLSVFPALLEGAGIAPCLLNKEAGHKIAPPLELERKEGDAKYGTSAVRILGGVHFKEKPYAPGVEYMVDHLSHLLVGQGTTPTELLKVIDSCGIHRAYLASKTVVGENLQEVLDHYPDFIYKIKPDNFSAMVILGLLTDPEDGKPDNYMVVLDKTEVWGFDENQNQCKKEILRSASIVGVDNDIAFSDPIVMEHHGERRGVHYVNVKNVLYFFPQMWSKVDPGFRDKFLAQSPENVMVQWLNGLAAKNKEYETLLHEGIFTLEEFQGDGGVKIKGKGMQLPIKLMVGTAGRLYHKIIRAQEYLRTHIEATHMDLFKHLERLLQRFYQEVEREQRSKTEGNAYVWASIQALYEKNAPAVQDVVELRSHLQSHLKTARQDASCKMTSIALKTAKHRGYEDKRTQPIMQAMEEFIGAIDYQRFTGKAAQALYEVLLTLEGIETSWVHIAAKFGNIPMLSFLKVVGASMAAITSNGYSALHVAAQRGDSYMVDALIEMGLSARVVDQLGETPQKKSEKRCKQLAIQKGEQSEEYQEMKQAAERLGLYASGKKPAPLPKVGASAEEKARLLNIETQLSKLSQEGDLRKRLQVTEGHLASLPNLAGTKTPGELQVLVSQYQGEKDEAVKRIEAIEKANQVLTPLAGLTVYQIERMVSLLREQGRLTQRLVNLEAIQDEANYRLRYLKEGLQIQMQEEDIASEKTLREMTAEEYVQAVELEALLALISRVPMPEVSEKIKMLEGHLTRLKNKIQGMEVSDVREKLQAQAKAWQGLITRLSRDAKVIERERLAEALSQPERLETAFDTSATKAAPPISTMATMAPNWQRKVAGQSEVPTGSFSELSTENKTALKQ